MAIARLEQSFIHFKEITYLIECVRVMCVCGSPMKTLRPSIIFPCVCLIWPSWKLYAALDWSPFDYFNGTTQKQEEKGNAMCATANFIRQFRMRWWTFCVWRMAWWFIYSVSNAINFWSIINIHPWLSTKFWKEIFEIFRGRFWLAWPARFFRI